MPSPASWDAHGQQNQPNVVFWYLPCVAVPSLQANEIWE